MDAALAAFMADLDIESDPPTPGPEPDIATEILSRHEHSHREDDLRLCAVVGATSQALSDQGFVPTPLVYFAAVVSTLQKLARDSPADSSVPALLRFLAVVIPRVPRAVVRKKWDLVVGILGKTVRTGLSAVGTKAVLMCIAGAIAAAEKENWEKISEIYGIVIECAKDNDDKVRGQAHSCLKDVLQTLRGLPLLSMASEKLTKSFERCLLLASGSNSASSTKNAETGAKEVLYYLNAMKDCLPLMSMKDTTTVLKNCKQLLNLHNQIVTKAIMEILLPFCMNSTSEVSPEVLLDLICLLASSVADNDNADEMASIARVLHFGTKKVYELDRQICVVKLPLIFKALGEVLACEHTEAIFAATEALKGLIYSCVDEPLVKQGVDQVNCNLRGETIIEKVCATMEGLLGYRYSSVWDMAFQVLSAAFDQLGISSGVLMMGTVRELADFQNLSEESFSHRKQLHECVGSAIRAMGPAIFLTHLPVKLNAEGSDISNVWLLPILKHYTVGASLNFFLQNILNMAIVLQRKSYEFEKDGQAFAARNAEGFVYALWSLLPAFCNFPIDTSTSFKDLQKVLRKTLSQKPDLHGIICSSLQILIQQNRSVIEDSLMSDGQMSSAERKAREHYTPQVAEENLKAIRSSCLNILYDLSDIILKSSKDSGGCLQATIREFASISDKKLVKRYFDKFNELLEKASKVEQPEASTSMQVDSPSEEASASQSRALLLDLQVSLLPGLSNKDINVLFSSVKSSLKIKDGLVQKKAYKALSIILKECDEFLSTKVDEVMSLMKEATNSCHVSAKRHRLDCLYYLIVHVLKDMSEQRKRDCIDDFLAEVLLALKESNKKARNRAYELLVKIGHACGDEEQGGKKENLRQFFYMIAGGIESKNTHMMSAAVKGLARLAYEFSDLIDAACDLLPTSVLLLKRQNREIIKATLGLIKVLVAKSKGDTLQTQLKKMLEGLLNWQNDSKNHFKAKVKSLVEMLVRKCGLEAVKAVMPEEHMKLLTNIRKINERKERKAKSEDDSASVHTRTTISRQSRWNHTRIFSDVGDEDDSDDGNEGAEKMSGRRSRFSVPLSRASLRMKRKLSASKSLPEDLLDQMDDDPLDLLDRERTRAAIRSSSANLKRKSEFHDEFEVDADGRLIIHEEGSRRSKSKDLAPDQEFDKKTQTSRHSAKSSVKTLKKRQKTSDSAYAYTGKEYTSGKAGGDLKKKDKLEPFAYWPLDRKLLNRRAEHKAVARKGMASVMKFAKGFEGKSASTALSVKRNNHKKKSKGKKNSK